MNSSKDDEEMDDKIYMFHAIIGRPVTSKLTGACSDGHRGDIFLIFIKNCSKHLY